MTTTSVGSPFVGGIGGGSGATGVALVASVGLVLTSIPLIAPRTKFTIATKAVSSAAFGSTLKIRQ